jgi:hypothetical protein
MSLLSNWLNGDLISAIRDKTNTAFAAIGLPLISATDTSFGYLKDKLVAGAEVTITQNNVGGNETLTIDVPDVAGKVNASSIINASISGAGPITCPTPGTDTVIATLTASTTKSTSHMKYTFMGFLDNNSIDTATIKIKKNGTEIARTKSTVQSGQLNFCLTWMGAYAANDIITATVAPNAAAGDVRSFILICECFDAI